MNILIDTYKTEISGGSNRSLLSVIDILLKEKNEITLLVPKKNGELINEARKKNIKCEVIPYSRIGIKKSSNIVKNLVGFGIMELKLLRDTFLTLKYKKHFKNGNYDIIYSNGSAVHFGRLLSRTMKIPHVWHIREYFDKSQLLPFKHYQRMTRNTDKFILISNDLKDEYALHIENARLEMISNGIKYENQHEKKLHDGINILLTGRICIAKRQLDAIKALDEILKKNNNANVNLYFAGKAVTSDDNAYQDTLNNFIADKAYKHNVNFMGEVKDMNSLRANMDIELMCSEREAFGRVTVEGMRAGLPIIGTCSGGTKDIIIDGYNGFFYEVKNYLDLSKKIETLINNRDLLDKISLQASFFAKENFTEKQLEKTADIIYKTAKR